jgi:hypothetical protein
MFMLNCFIFGLYFTIPKEFKINIYGCFLYNADLYNSSLINLFLMYFIALLFCKKSQTAHFFSL